MSEFKSYSEEQNEVGSMWGTSYLHKVSKGGCEMALGFQSTGGVAQLQASL